MEVVLPCRPLSDVPRVLAGGRLQSEERREKNNAVFVTPYKRYLALILVRNVARIVCALFGLYRVT